MMKLKVNEEAKKFAMKLEKEHPSLVDYHDLISEELGCSFEEVVCLDVHPDNMSCDEEGWKNESFFPKGVDPQTKIIDDDYHTSDFSVGSVVRLTHEGVVFIAETNASPWTVYANPQTFERL